MPRFSKNDVTTKIIDIGLVPVLYNPNVDISERIIAACYYGGAKVVEFTNRGDLAYQVFTELVEGVGRELSDIVLGAGTISDPATAILYINSGANFIVGPSFNPEVAKVCNRRKVMYIPGCSTPTEISNAEEMGADIIKVFPAKVLTPYFVKAVLAPFPQSRLMPSGGIEATREEVFSWIKAGATALNMGGDLIDKDLINAGDFEGLRKKIEQCLEWVKEARQHR
ncbi:MAG: bifunctional 4-hydroxy-2-oxoglutarate aldolase/2-dehydro-3-deoxy-phosphogluconate aldolase [Nitrososphaeria archaeon]